MKILYIGQLMEPGAYESLVGSGSASLNPSGQNYHSLLVKALARNNDVTVVSTLKDPNVHQNSRNPVYCYPRKSDGFMEKLYLTMAEGKTLYKDRCHHHRQGRKPHRGQILILQGCKEKPQKCRRVHLRDQGPQRLLQHQAQTLSLGGWDPQQKAARRADVRKGFLPLLRRSLV